MSGEVVNCSSRSAATHNLTVYGAEILYTPQGSSNTTATNATMASTIDTGTAFEFQLYNAVLGVDAQCSTHVNQTDVSDAWHSCFVESRDTRITTAFQFDLGRHTVTVRETWVCDDDARKANGTTRWQAGSTNSMDLLCTETANADTGQHYCAREASGPLPVDVIEVAGDMLQSELPKQEIQ
ncbi:hypothetical protein HMPREF1624_06986 [Sporothrix schenckii ATCC 58251]|uniref:AA1-like domain-containing protein n=1 Tax=Sporothrix schenckii (strain ATCC 58251 / de Perez 2211183) TaxID=1391915 RepID=U7PMH5_SPOS1|nr:hypothetical protein HMPREF1624_06986 [Sporothrix schenckii ATCC 58251]